VSMLALSPHRYTRFGTCWRSRSVVPIAADQSRPAGRSAIRPDAAGRRDGLERPRIEHRPCDSRNGLPIEPGLIAIPGRLLTYDAAGLGLPEGVVEGKAETPPWTRSRLRIERFADARKVRSEERSWPPRYFGSIPHQRRIAVGAEYPHGDAVLAMNEYQRSCVEAGVEHNLRDAVRPRPMMP